MKKHVKNYSLAVVILAGGKGTRMKDPSKAKVMYEILGKPMIHYVVDLANQIKSSKTIVVVGYQRDSVIDYLHKSHPTVEIAIQAEQLGTGHAVMQTEDNLKDFTGNILILSGDVPLLTFDTIHKLISLHEKENSSAAILTAELKEPGGYGRIIRNSDSSVAKIVEHKDASEEEKKICEINSGIYVFRKEELFESLQHITPQNSQNEYYLTDVFEYFWKKQWKVSALKAENNLEVMGINTIEQLNEVQEILARADK